VKKGDPFPLCSNAWLLVDELHAGRPAPRQHCIQIVDCEADVMNARTPPGHEPRDWGVGVICFQKLYQGLARAEPDYVRAIGIVETDLWQPQYIPEKRKAPGEGLDRDSNVGHARSTRG
jgi:hypothetical protein